MHAYVHTLNFRGPRCIAVAKQTPKKETKNGKALQRVKKQKKVIKMPKRSINWVTLPNCYKKGQMPNL